jgi:pyruvate/2-oxoglutarate dehydrogenase complex dihydrolipoamide dehydrogenase (E3) component
LIRAAKFVEETKNSFSLGIESRSWPLFPGAMDRSHCVTRTVELHDAVERYSRLGVTIMHGHAKIASFFQEVQVNGKRLTNRAVVIAAGARLLRLFRAAHKIAD